MKNWGDVTETTDANDIEDSNLTFGETGSLAHGSERKVSWGVKWAWIRLKILADKLGIKQDLYLDQVDNTSDVDKPVSNATQTALNDKADQTDLDDTDSQVATNTIKLSGIEDNANNYVLPSDVVQDPNYVHTDNNYTDAEKAQVSDNTAHRGNTSNPHSVTASQVGAYTKTEADDLLALKSDETETVQRLARKEFDGGVAFNGVNAFATMPAKPMKLGLGSGTFLVKFSTSQPTEPQTIQRVGRADAGRKRYGFLTWEGKLRLEIDDDTTLKFVDSVTILQADTVYEAIGVIDRESDEMVIYLEGNAEASLSIAGYGDLDDDSDSASLAAYINANGFPGLLMEGSIYESTFFNFALSSDQVAELNEIGTGAFLAKYPELKWGDGDISYTEGGSSSFTGSGPISNTAANHKYQLNYGAAKEGTTIRIHATITDGGEASSIYIGWGYGIGSEGSVVVLPSVTGTQTVEVELPVEATWENAAFSRVNFGADTGLTVSVVINSVDVLGCTSYLPMQDGACRMLVDQNPANLPAVIEGDYEHLKTKADTDEVLLADYTLTNVTATTGVALNGLQDDLCREGKQVTRTEIFYESGDMLGCYLEAERDSDGTFEQVTLTKTITKAKDALGVIYDTSELEDSFSLWLRGNLSGATARIKVYGR